MADTCPLCRGATIRGGGVHPKRGAMMPMYECNACGRYYVSTPEGLDTLHGLSDEDRFALSALARQASDAGKPLELLREDIKEIIVGAPRLALGDKIDRLLLMLAKRAKATYLGPLPLTKEHDFPLVFANGPKGMNELLVILMQRGLLEAKPNEIRLTISAWERIDALRAAQPDSRQAFVAMWFDPSLDEAWEKGFKLGIERSKYFRALRVDNVQHNQKIDDRIIAELKRSGLVVADFTGQRGGVYYEAGFARGLGIPVVSTCRDDDKEKLHFDTRQYNHIFWKAPADLADQLHDRIAATALPKGWTAPS